MKKYAFIILLALIMLALPYHLRYFGGNQTFAGDEPYYHSKIAQTIAEQGVISQISLAKTSTPYSIQPYHLVLAGMFKLTGNFAFAIVPIFFSLLSLLLFYYLLKQLKLDDQTQLWTLLVFVLSPAFISLGFYNTPFAFDLTLVLAGLLILFTKKPFYSTIPFLAASANSLPAAIASLFCVAYFALTDKTKKIKTIALGIIPLSCIIFIDYNLPFKLLESPITYFSDLGGIFGIGAFTVILSLISAILLWPRKNYTAFFSITAFITAAVIYPSLLPFVLPITSILAGYALSYLFRRKWELTSLRTLTLFVIFLGLLFSAISYSTTHSRDGPSQEIITTLSLIEPGTILTAKEYANWASYYHKTLLHPIVKQKIIESQQNDAGAILFSNDLEKTNQLLQKHEVNYVLITPEMRQGLVWTEENFGLAFLVNNNETFKRIPTDNSIELYKVT
jgi:uncharacterized membrane protein